MESKDILNTLKEIVNKSVEKENELLNSIKNDITFAKIKFIYGEENKVYESIIINAETINKLIELTIDENESFKSKYSKQIKDINTFLDI